MGCTEQRCAGSGAVDAPVTACMGYLVYDESSHCRCLPRAQVEVLADKNGGLMRLLGVEIGTPDSTTEPRCHRFAAIVEDGILLKLVGAGGGMLGAVMAVGWVAARAAGCWPHGVEREQVWPRAFAEPCSAFDSHVCADAMTTASEGRVSAPAHPALPLTPCSGTSPSSCHVSPAACGKFAWGAASIGLPEHAEAVGLRVS